MQQGIQKLEAREYDLKQQAENQDDAGQDEI